MRKRPPLPNPLLQTSEGGEGEDAQGNFFTASDPLQKRLFSKLTGLTRLKGFWLGTGALRGNPKGIGSFSPGLRGTSYPGTARARSFFPTLKGLHQSHAVSPT